MRDGELVGAVLRGGGEHAGRADALHEALREHGVQHAEARRGADVHRDAVFAVVVDELTDLAADTRQRVVPAHASKLAVDALHRVQQAVRRVVHLVLLETLEAAVATRGDVIVVGFDVLDLATVDGDLEATECLTNAAEGLHCLSHDRLSI